MKIKNALMRSRLIFLLFFVSIIISAGTVESTNVSGILETNTTWTVENSPYYVVGNVLVPEGGKLSIEAGVVIEFTGYYKLYVDGGLEAIGNSSDYISFTSNSTSPHGDHAGIIFRGTSCCDGNVLDRTNLKTITVGVSSSSIRLTNSIMDNANVEIYSKYFSVIENNTFENCSERQYIRVRDGNIVASDNHFDGCPIHLNSHEGSLNFKNNIVCSTDDEGIRISCEEEGKVVLYNNSVYGNNIGVHIDIMELEDGGYLKLLNNRITSNSVGLEFREIWLDYDSELSILYNVIVDNDVGIVFYYDARYNELFNMTYNDIINNSDFNVVCDFDFPDSVSMPYNWWGTTNTSKINESIHDFYDDFARGYIIYQPILNESVNESFPPPTTTTIPTTTTTIPSEDNPPDVDIDYSSKIVFTDEEIVINVSAMDDNGLLYIWAGDDRGLYGHYDCNGEIFCSNTWNVQITDEGLYTLVGVAMDTNNQLKRICSSNILVMERGSVPPDSSTTTTIASGGTEGRSSGGGSKGGSSGFSAVSVMNATCFDGIQNCHHGSCEEGMDCGGPCKPCHSCDDDIQNQGEKGIDCGGPCPPCEVATTTAITTTSVMIPTTTLTTTTLSESTITLEETKTMSVAPTGLIGQTIKFSEENPEFVKGIIAGMIISLLLVVYAGHLIHRKISM